MCQRSVLEVWNEDAFIILKYSATHCQNIKEIKKKGSEKKCTVSICSFWLQSDVASLFCPCGFIVWGQLVSCPGSAWLVCSLSLSLSLSLSVSLCLSPVSLSQAHQGPAPKYLVSSPILNEWSLCPKPSPNDAATQKFRGMHSSCENSGASQVALVVKVPANAGD